MLLELGACLEHVGFSFRDSGWCSGFRVSGFESLVWGLGFRV